jgi:hypothetical protein
MSVTPVVTADIAPVTPFETPLVTPLVSLVTPLKELLDLADPTPLLLLLLLPAAAAALSSLSNSATAGAAQHSLRSISENELELLEPFVAAFGLLLLLTASG